jgi:hypothetical protein
MKISRWTFRSFICLSAVLGATSALGAQSVSTGAFNGSVSGEDGK